MDKISDKNVSLVIKKIIIFKNVVIICKSTFRSLNEK